VLASVANTHDSKLFEPLLDTVPGVRGHRHRHRPGRPRRRPDKVHADKGYDQPPVDATCTGVGSRSASRGAGSRTRPASGVTRWVVERTVSWLLRFKRLGLRYDRTERTLRPLLLLAISITNLRCLISLTVKGHGTLGSGCSSRKRAERHRR
jgi:transposase